MQSMKWLSDKITTLTTQAHQAVNTVIHKSDIIFDKAFTVFKYTFDPAILIAINRSPQTRKVFVQSLTANIILYMGPILLYEAGVKPLLPFVPGMRSDQEMALDTLVAWLALRMASRNFIDNTLYNSCVSKAILEDHPLHPEEITCEDGVPSAVRAALISPFDYMGKMLAAHMLSSSLPLGQYFVGYPLRALAYGQTFIEYKLSAQGMCTQHRYDILNKNNSYCFWLGVSFLATVDLSHLLVQKTTGVNNPFVYDALFSLLFQYYIALALLMDKPLPGKIPGYDIFYYSREAMQHFLTKASDALALRLRNPENRGQLIVKMQALMKSMPVTIAKYIFLGEDFASLQAFVKRSAPGLFIDFYGEGIQSGLQWLISVREIPMINQLKSLSFLLPNFIVSAQAKKIISVILAKNLDAILHQSVSFIETARLRTKIYDRKTLNDIARLSANEPEYMPTTNKQEESDGLDDWTLLEAESLPQISVVNSSKALQQNSLFAIQPLPQQVLSPLQNVPSLSR